MDQKEREWREQARTTEIRDSAVGPQALICSYEEQIDCMFDCL